jgi:hypothetical protein
MVDNVQCGSRCQFNNYVALDCIYLAEHKHTTKTSARIVDYGLCFKPGTFMTQIRRTATEQRLCLNTSDMLPYSHQKNSALITASELHDATCSF